MKTGYYIVKHRGKLIFARWDGLMFNHEYGQSRDNEIVPHNRWQRIRKSMSFSVQPIALGCPNGCSCTVNPDGSIHVNCQKN